MERLVRLFANLGVTKLRVTGGEPFFRKGFVEFLERICNVEGLQGVYITTNGALATPHIRQLKELGISGINLSLDTLERKRFVQISGRDAFDDVHRTLFELLAYDVPLKINMVVLGGFNSDEILPVSGFAKDYPMEVRFIEQMPFDGGTGTHATQYTAQRIVEILQSAYPTMAKIKQRHSTASIYNVAGFKGTLGIIGGYSRIFCTSCNRIRVTPEGMLKTCLYGTGSLDLRKLLRRGANDGEIQSSVRTCLNNRDKNGFEAESRCEKIGLESMASIGG
jgi:cyclic pyranopterin phosphate synthase